MPDERFDYLCDKWKPPSKIPAYLHITDIAGLVKGAAEGAGLGNAFLSHIQVGARRAAASDERGNQCLSLIHI